MNKKRMLSITGFFMMIVTLIVTFAQPIYASEPSKQIVKVAYFDMGDYYKEISDGVVDSYDTEVLNNVEKYSNLKFEYVNCGTWAHALEMLDQDKVDLVGTVQWTNERDPKYEFSLESYGYTVAELAALPDSGFIYEDYDAIGRATIGCVDPYVRIDELNQLFSDHGISPRIKFYDTQPELLEALETGEVDLVAANSHTIKKTYKVIEKFDVSPYFFVSRKGNCHLTDQIDDAIININVQEPGKNDELMKKYFPANIGAPLTKAEIDLISENKTYDVYFDADTKPTSWFDEKSKTMQGGLIEVCKMITENTGLKLHPVPMYAGKTKLDGSVIRTTTVYYGVNENILSIPGETRALLDENFNLYYRKDRDFDVNGDATTIGIIANRVHLKNYIENTYPQSSIKEFKTPAECLKAIENREVDAGYLDCRIADNAITENGINNVKQYPIAPQQQGIALLFPEQNQDLLVSIVNKGLESVDQDALNSYFIQLALDTDPPVTLKTVVENHLSWFMISAFAFAIILAGAAMSFTYAIVMKQQRDKIEKADSDRTEFFGRMSHDMRTPMNGVLGMIELSENSNSLPEIRENLKKAKAAGQYMLSLINDTLDLQRLESKKLQLEKNIVKAKDYYNEIFSIMKVSAEQKHINFDVKYVRINMNEYMELDAVRVKQIFANLISNAIKFTPEGGAVEVTIESIGASDNILHHKFQVRDTGVGMSKDFMDSRLFQPYSQENNQLSTQLTGSGLGMAITKNLIEIMGGHMEVRSELGEGTIFTVYLDIKQATKEEAEEAAKKETDNSESSMEELSGKRILLCEDHPLNAEIAKRLLEKAGCIVEWAENGQLGVEKFEKSDIHGFDAILMDIRMPIMDGLTATKNIRKLSREDAATIPIIAMTANAYESDIQNCHEAGMNAHLAKPVNPAVMYETLEKYLKA